MRLTRFWTSFGLAFGASAAVVVAPLATGFAWADGAPSAASVTSCLPAGAGSLLGGVPVVGSALGSSGAAGSCSLTGTSASPDLSGTLGSVAGVTSSVPAAPSLPAAPAAPALPDASGLAGAIPVLPTGTGAPSVTSIPLVATVLGSAGSGSGTALPSGAPSVGAVLGVPGAEPVSGAPSFGSIPLLGSVVSGAGLPSLPISGTAGQSGTDPAVGGPDNAFLDSSWSPPSDPSTAPATLAGDGGGFLPFTGEPMWIRLAGLAALAGASAFGLASIVLGFLRRRIA